jgi:hypothetical protein
VRGTATSVSAVKLPTSRTAVHQHRHLHREGRHATTTDTPTRARTSTQMPMRHANEESITTILSTKTCQIKRNRRNPANNSSNPRTPKTPKSGPLTHRFGRGIVDGVF